MKDQTSPPPNSSSMSSLHLLLLILLSSFLTQSSSSSPSQVSISISPQIIPKSGDSVRVQWSNIDSPSHLDWLGIYSPANSSHEDFIGYFFLSSCPTWQSGSGNLSFPLVNLRSDYEFRIFRWTEDEIDHKHHDHDHNPLPGTKHHLSASEKFRFKSGGGPEQIHLAFSERCDEMRVMFITDDGRESFVKYGVREDRMDDVAATGVGRYEREDMCDSPANQSVGWRDPGYIHDGVLTNLKEGKRYYYKVYL